MLSLLSKRPKVTSLTAPDFMLAFTKHWFEYAEAVIGLMSDNSLQSLITNEIFHLALSHADTALLMSLFGKSSPKVQQYVIEDLLVHLASFDDDNNFLRLLNTEILDSKCLTNGETLLNNLLKKRNLKYCWAIINCETNQRLVVLANNKNETPLKISIDAELFDLINPIISNCEEQLNPEFNWHDPLMALLQKLLIMTNNTVFIDYFRSHFMD